MKRDLMIGLAMLLGEGIAGSAAMIVYAFDRGRYDMGAFGAALLIIIALFSGYLRLKACFLDLWDRPTNPT